jgi:hypothetical protein
VAKLKEKPGQNLVVYGSSDLVHSLLEHDLIDEYRLWVYPVVLGKGRSFFEDGVELVLDLCRHHRDCTRAHSHVPVATVTKPRRRRGLSPGAAFQIASQPGCGRAAVVRAEDRKTARGLRIAGDDQQGLDGLLVQTALRVNVFEEPVELLHRAQVKPRAVADASDAELAELGRRWCLRHGEDVHRGRHLVHE